jgi:hypothetical protein
MPGGDRTGPAGMGPMTGRAAGYCGGYSAPGYINPYSGRYSGAGRFAFGGRGRGYRNWYYSTGLPGWYRYGSDMPAGGWYPYYGSPYRSDIDPEEETRFLKNQAEMLKKQLDDVQSRMEEIRKELEKKEK